MSRPSLPIALVASLSAGAAAAEPPRVAADIAPVHSLVAQVMGDLGSPELIVSPGASPHEYSLRPSEAAALESADLVFWVGEALTPWMAGAVANLARDAGVTELLEVEGTQLFAMREDALFEAHVHGEGHHQGDDHGHGHGDEHGHGHDEAHDDGHGHDEAHDHDHGHDDAHDEAHGHGHDHGHGAVDAHAWLSPANAAVWLSAIASELSRVDPANAATYEANAAAARADLDALVEEIEATLDPVRGGNFVSFHDAYQYFEAAFDIPASGAIAMSDAADPSPARVAEIRDRIAGEGITCVLAEPQFNDGLVSTVMGGTAARTAVVDPLGATLEPGPGLYGQMMRGLATALAECLGG